ncbi:ABC transporter substrate-binding protein [Flavimaricola marinus]|uniref:Probable sugar-binding periplasmic protein n=1 Tax=Flavimaricola marinus TaxID=1819565 RepID=A0A238L9G3_9RHOB|nr:ABC transporter substrate-binding protein [Flavimaricola marinus]SMY06241.1 putative sugar-binding periplasmic protein precursor [Flavimaricola marinus]
MKLAPMTLNAALLLGVSTLSAHAEDLVVFQSWSSPAEVAALNVLHEAVAEKGINWIDITIPHDTGSSVSLLNLVIGGQPPNIFSENNTGVYRDLTEMGLGRDMTAAFEESGALEHFSDAVRHAITIDGEIRKMPLGVHIDGMVYYNLEVAEAAGVDPTSWGSLDDMLADFDKITEAGYVPLAVGAQQWQIGYLTHALMATLAGPEIYNQFYALEPDEAAFDTAEVRSVFEWLRKFQQAADDGSVNRDWNMTTNNVISGQALMQIHGDWMKGEWRAAGKEPGTDFGCIPIPGYRAVAVTVDGWGALGGQEPEIDAAQMLFAQTVTDPVVNAEFASVKGATPVRDDVDLSTVDVCSQRVLELLADNDRQVNNPSVTVDADWSNSVWEIAFNFWSDPEMSVDDAIAALHDQHDVIFY